MTNSRFPALSRRGFIGLTGGVAAAAALTACAGTGGGSGDSGDANTITFWSNHPGTSKELELELINRFQTANPGLTVNLVDAGKNYEEVAQKFNAALTGGELPDVVVLSDVWWFNYALSKAIEPMDGHFGAAGVQLDDYVDSLAADYLFDGKHYALPYARSTPLFYYNKNIWSQAGLPDRGPESWQEFDEWGPRIQALGTSKIAHAWGDAKNYLAWTFQGPNWTFGGAYSDEWTLKFTDPGSIAAATYLRESINVKKYANVSQQIAVDFGTGGAASIIGSTGSLTGILKDADGKFEVGTAFLPHPNGPGVTTGGAGLAIPSRISDERKVNALKFIEFLTNAASTAYFAQNTGYMPVRKSAVAEPSQVAFMEQNPHAKVAIDQLAVSKSQDYARVFVPGADQVIGTGYEQICLQNADPATVLAKVSADVQAIIDRQITPKLPK